VEGRDAGAVIRSDMNMEESALVIRPSKGWTTLDLAELWRYRELIFFLSWRDTKVRYKKRRSALPGR